MVASRILGAVDALVLKRSKERLGHRIIVTYSGMADGLPEVISLQRPGELTGRVVAAAIRMENSTSGERVITGGHLDSLLDERGLIIIVRRPADHGFRMAVDNRRKENPAPQGRNVGDIAALFLPWPAGGKTTRHEVGDVVPRGGALGEVAPPRPRLARLQAQLTHQRPHQLRPGRH